MFAAFMPVYYSQQAKHKHVVAETGGEKWVKNAAKC
jgi:hypothetical protein